MSGENFINILSDENIDGYANGQITGDFLIANREDSYQALAAYLNPA